MLAGTAAHAVPANACHEQLTGEDLQQARTGNQPNACAAIRKRSPAPSAMPATPTSPTPAAGTPATTSASLTLYGTHEADIRNTRSHNTNTPGPCAPTCLDRYVLSTESARLGAAR